jgi:hypothetical protein
MSIALEITTEETSPSFEEMTARIAPRQLLNVMGRAAANLVRDHLVEHNQENPNKMGGERTNYYTGAARATHFDLVGDGAVISINQVGMSLHYYGGTVVPGAKTSAFTGKPTQYLTIPARAEAHGHRASEFPDLIVLWGKNGPYALARAISQQVDFVNHKAKKAGEFIAKYTQAGAIQGGEVMFWLVKSATISPDPTVIPSEEEFSEAINSAVSECMSLLSSRAQDQHE